MLRVNNRIFQSKLLAWLLACPIAPAFAQDTVLDTVVVTSTTIDDRFTGKRGEPATLHEISGQTVDEKRPENMIEIHCCPR